MAAPQAQDRIPAINLSAVQVADARNGVQAVELATYDALLQVLRTYQQEALQLLIHHWTLGNQAPGQMPGIQWTMGLGKSWIIMAAACMARMLLTRPNQPYPAGQQPRILVLVPNTTIREQLARNIRQNAPAGSPLSNNHAAVVELVPSVTAQGLVMALNNPDPMRVVVACYQSRGKLLQVPAGLIDFIIVDEAHHSRSKSHEGDPDNANYLGIFQHFANAQRLLVTANMRRHDDATVTCTVISKRSMRWAAQEGHIKKPILAEVAFEELRFQNLPQPYAVGAAAAQPPAAPGVVQPGPDVIVNTLAGMRALTTEQKKACQYSPGVLAAQINATLRCIYELRYKTGTPYFGLLVAQSIAQAKLVLDLARLTRFAVPTADPANPNQARAAILVGGRDEHNVMARMANGDVDLVVFCQMLSEGYDNPLVGVVTFCYSPESQPFFEQVLGRGVRRVPNNLPATMPGQGLLVGQNLVGSLRQRFPNFYPNPPPGVQQADNHIFTVVVTVMSGLKDNWDALGVDDLNNGAEPLLYHPPAGQGVARVELVRQRVFAYRPELRHQAMLFMQLQPADQLADLNHNPATQQGKADIRVNRQLFANNPAQFPGMAPVTPAELNAFLNALPDGP